MNAYLARLDTLQGWVEAKVAELPRNQRKLVTNHDAFGYFANEYGFTVMAVAGLSKNDQPGSKKVAELIEHAAFEHRSRAGLIGVSRPTVLVGGYALAASLGLTPQTKHEEQWRMSVSRHPSGQPS
jgi:hypothetical protein